MLWVGQTKRIATFTICHWVFHRVGLGPVPGMATNQQASSFCYKLLNLLCMLVAVCCAYINAQVLAEAGLLTVHPRLAEQGHGVAKAWLDSKHPVTALVQPMKSIFPKWSQLLQLKGNDR